MKWPWSKPEPVPAPIVERKAIKFSLQDMAEAQRPRVAGLTPDQVFNPYIPIAGVIPTSGMAMDALPAITSPIAGAVSAIASNIFHEGIGFLGYPYLAQLSQRVEFRHACEIWAEHATRKFVEIHGPDDKVKAINDEFTRLDVKGAFNALAVKDHLFGRSQLFLDFDDAEDATELGAPLTLVPEKINERRPLQRLKVIDPIWSYPAPYDTSNPLSENFYQPKQWYVNGRTVHATRLLTVIGREVPDILKPAYAFGGQSLTALMKAYVDNWLRTRQSVSDLLHSFSVMVLGTDLETMTTPGAQTSIAQRVMMFNGYRDNNGLMVVNKNTEALTNVAAPIAGLEGLQAQAQEQLASAARIPLSLYLQITPTGLNASSEGEIRSFYADVKAYQENKLRAPLQTVLEVVQLSLFGAIDPDITFEFEPLWEMSATDAADIRLKDAQAAQIYVNAGVVSNDEERDRLREDETSPYHGGLAGGAPEVEDDTDAPDDGDDTMEGNGNDRN